MRRVLLTVLAFCCLGGCVQNVTKSDGGTSTCNLCVASIDCPSGEVCVEHTSLAICLRPCAENGACGAGETCSELTGPDAGIVAACLPAACNAPADGGQPHVSTDAGPSIPKAPVTANLTADAGGTESVLYFAVVGDTRPPSEDDTSAYPTNIIQTIYQHIQSLTPAPPFVLSTGDYQYASVNGGQQQAQLGNYLAARNEYAGIDWPAMGNHECDGYTNSTCGFSGSQYPPPGITPNFNVWANLFLKPIGESTPNYVRTVKATDSSWTAKFIIVAPNFWDSSTQNAWLTQALSVSTTYTFVVHHEDKGASSAPPALATIESLEAGKETLSIVGHSHQWRYNAATPELIVGNGGAPLDSHAYGYGFTLFTQQSNGSILVTPYESCSSAGVCMNTPLAITAEAFSIQ
jgi:hypothetical protein